MKFKQDEHTRQEKGFYAIIMIAILSIILSGCYVTAYTPDPIYEDHPHSTEIYYYGTAVYFGYYSGFYYYYGVPHFYPWWYYYQFIPPHHFHTHSHVYVHCDNGHYVYGHRGPTLNNNVAKDFRPNIKVKTNKDKSFVFPRDWKSKNSTRTTKQNDINYSINKINYNRTFGKKNLNNKSNVNINRNINRNNINTNKNTKPRQRK